MVENQVAVICRRTDLQCLFQDNVFQHTKDMLNRLGSFDKHVKKYVEILEATQQDEQEYFWKDVGRSNLLVFLYYISGKYDEALEQSRRTLQPEHSPNNITALIAQMKIHMENEETRKVREAIEKCKKLLGGDDMTAERERLLCASEVAYAYSYMGPAFYMEAIERYEQVLARHKLFSEQHKNDVSGNQTEISINGWLFHLGQTYNRMLNKGNLQRLYKKGHTIRDVYGKICKYLTQIIDDSDDKFYKGKAMIELVDAFKKSEIPSEERVEFPRKYGTIDDFAFGAMTKSPGDPYVLERCGRHYRARASNKQQLREAISIFEKLLAICPKRHVGRHQMGLAYRSLWLEVGKYPEAKLHTNAARKGSRHNAKNGTRNKPQDANSYSSLAGDTGVRNTPPSSDPLPRSVSLDSPCHDPADTNMSGVPQTAPAWLPTVRPKYPTAPGTIPKQPRKPDYFDQLRCSNPRVKPDSESGKHLQKANECFIEADKITGGIHCRYLVDLARTYVSLGNREEANRCFRNAAGNKASSDNNELAYLYEQWALSRHEEWQDEMDEDDLTDVMDKYRKSILSCVRAGIRSRMALYKLRDILSDLLTKGSTNEAVKLEHKVLFSSIQDHERSRRTDDYSQLVKAIESDEEVLNITKKMIRLLYERAMKGQKGSAAAAFMYLTAMHEAGKLDLQKDGTPGDFLTEVEIVDVAERVAADDLGGGGWVYGDVFRWMVGTQTFLDREVIKLDHDVTTANNNNASLGSADNGTGTEHCAAPETVGYDTCVVSPYGDTPEIQNFVNFLGQYCGINVGTAYAEGEDDTEWGVFKSEAIRRVVAHSKSVMLVGDCGCKEWGFVTLVLEELTCKPEAIVCRILMHQSDRDVEERYKIWPRFVLNEECTERCLASSLIRTIVMKTR